MRLSGNDVEVPGELAVLLQGDEMFHEFNNRELHLIRYSAWIVRSWEDHILELLEQVSLM